MTQHNKTLWEGVLSAVNSTAGTRPTEPFSETLQRVIARHIAAEETSLQRYQDLLETSKDPIVRMLLSELMRDEEHHHGMLRRMEAQLEAELGETSARPFHEETIAMPEADRKAMVTEVKDLANHEASGVKHLRSVAKDARAAGSDLLALLLDALANDSQKHEKILGFLAKRIANA